MSSSGPSAETIKAVQAASLLAVSAASGATLGLSFFLVPRLLDSPTPLMLRQWERNLVRGRNFLAPLDVLASLGFAGLAFSRVFPARLARCYAAAAVLAAGIVPYTVFFIGPTNRKLKRRATLASALADADEMVEPADERESSRFLVDRWGTLNLGRFAMLVSSAMLGLYASL